MRRAVAIALCLIYAAGCASRPPSVEAPAASAGEQWRRLQSEVQAGSGRQAYSRVQWEGGDRRIGFDATIATDSQGHFLLEALTPVGTSAATLWSDGQNLVFINHRNSTWWQGRVEEVPEAAPLVPALRAVGVQAAAQLLFGFPVHGASVPCESPYAEVECYLAGGLTHLVSAEGLLSATGDAASIEFSNPSVPATRVMVRTPAGALSILHRSIEESDAPVERPIPPDSWHCCVLPAFE